MHDSPVTFITREALDVNINIAKKEISNVFRLYEKGLLPYDEKRDMVSSIFLKHFNDFIYRNFLSVHVSPKNWPSFCELYGTWLDKGEIPPNSKEIHWLLITNSITESGVNRGDDAPFEDQISVLKLMRTFRVPAEYFRPVPVGILVPDIHQSRSLYEKIIGFNIWNKINTSDEFKIGNTVTIVDHHGLRSILRIDRYISEAEKTRYQDSDYICFGTIEGYTSDRPREIKVYMKDDSISYLSFHYDDDDLRHEMWKAYYIDRAQISAVYEQIIEELARDNLSSP